MSNKKYDQIIAYILENQEKFYRLAYSYANCREDALDIVQNSIIKALENYTSLHNVDAVRTWFYRILVNESLNYKKKSSHEQLSENGALEEVPYEDHPFEGDSELYEKVNELPEEVQHIIKLRFYEEMSLKEIAKVMRMNLNTVKAKLYRGIKQLNQEIGEVEYE